MYIIGLDLETTGLSPTENRLTEIGAVLWETESRSPVLFFNELVDPETPLSPEIIELTGITQQQLNMFSISEISALRKLNEFLKYSKVLVAHNAAFDRDFLAAAYTRCGFMIPEKSWIDTSTDVPYPKKIDTRKLKHLACEHNLLNPFSHRATTDVLTMLQVLSHYEIDEVLALSKIPNIVVRAKTSFDQKEIAKGRGFRWDGDAKVWIKRIKETQFKEEETYFYNLNIGLEVWK